MAIAHRRDQDRMAGGLPGQRRETALEAVSPEEGSRAMADNCQLAGRAGRTHRRFTVRQRRESRTVMA